MERRNIGPKIAHSREKNEAHANIQDGIRVREVYDATMTGGQRAPDKIGRAAGNRDDSIFVNERPRGAAWSARHPVKVEIHSQYPVMAQRLTSSIFLLVTKKSPFQPHSLWIASRGINFHEFSSILRVL
jgi:hypothetical protein